LLIAYPEDPFSSILFCEANELNIEQQVAAHYSRDDLASVILAALQQAGKDITRLQPQDLAAVDEFHIRGAQATAELAEQLDLEPGLLVLDVGSGLGGPSRHIAHRSGCRVVGIDLTADYCRCAAQLAARVGLGDQVEYHQGSALAMPFPSKHFDRAFTQHVAMNIQEKAVLYREIHRVLKPAALFGLYDVLQGPGGEVHFPVPWARDASASFLVRPDELQSLLEESGFKVVHWNDHSDAGLAWFEQTRRRVEEQGPPPLGLHLLMGSAFAEMASNMIRNLKEQRALPTQVVCRVQ
jgi:MPBQ/MSBQ methyltransferase